MNQTYTPLLLWFRQSKLFTLLCCGIGLGAYAQSEPFQCDYNAYLFQYNDIYALDLASGSAYLVAEDITSGNVNAAAYNSADGYIWGYLSTPAKTIVRIGKNFQTESYNIPELPDSNNKYVGDVSIDGIYYLRSGSSTYYSIDLNPESNTYLEFLNSHVLNKSISVHDWAFNAVDGKLYTVEKNTNHLYRITADTGDVEDLGEVPILSGLNYTYGAVYFDADGNFYVSANQTGSVYIISNVQNAVVNGISSNIFAFGPSSSLNDGARCPTAPVPQEDCINGLDDDGDGLVDCDDPSCSGVSSCPVITPTSSGNNGGLESNDRLAGVIGRRNYQRAKRGYRFDNLTAKQVRKSKSYKKAGKYSKNNIPLATLVPLGVIGETETVESTPTDLLNLTNASEIYTVDYLKNKETKGALMVIKTENGVYEHSKFICDRFLGAELLSVSTINIQEHSFIKSIIKQADGSIEYVLMLSARLNGDNQFVVESHWNIDAYEKGAAFYNFQVWANSVDDLVTLGEEILALLAVNAPITDYKASTPPPVFVKSARYRNGSLEMELVNTNKSNAIRMEGGMKLTETSTSETIRFEKSLAGYLDSVRVDTGALFDFGFRIQNEKGDTPDDLFVADAPWGLDASYNTSTAKIFEILPNEEAYRGDGYRVERNVHLEGTTNDYLGVYRALSPRFAPVDLSAFQHLVFEASGTGQLQVKLLKGNGMAYRTTVQLSDAKKVYTLSAELFKSDANEIADFKDLKVISFELHAKNGTDEEKKIMLEDVEFANFDTTNDFILADTKKSILMPNPMSRSSILYFYEDTAATYTFELYTMNGKIVPSHRYAGESRPGQNQFTLERGGLPSGIYLYKLQSSNEKTWSGKLMVR